MRRLILLCLVALSALVASFASSPRAEAAPYCPIHFLGVHGTGEESTWTDTTDHIIHDTAVKLILWQVRTGTPDLMDFHYPTNPRVELVSYLNVPQISTYLHAGLKSLSQALDAERRIDITIGCPKSYFLLSGYSLGAWIVDDWMYNAVKSADDVILGVSLYGDPQWYDVGNGALGVARWSGFGLPLPPSLSPYLNVPYAWKSWCNPGDPICGEPPQSIGVAACILALTVCPHFRYDNGPTQEGADFLASRTYSGAG